MHSFDMSIAKGQSRDDSDLLSFCLLILVF